MNLICCKNRKKSDQHKSLTVLYQERYEKLIDSVTKEKSFNIKKVIEYGNFGASIIVSHKETDAEFRLKISKKQYVGEKEKEWKKFDHINLLPVLKIEYMKNTDCFLFLSPAEDVSLKDKIDSKLFRKDRLALWRLLNWLREICAAVKYLHDCGYAHCSLEAKNMIIRNDDVLKISEFSFLSSTKRRTYRYGLLQSLRPPQSYFDLGGTYPVNPEKFDSWAIGVLILEMFTGSYLSKKLTKHISSWTKVYPVMFDVLEKYTFSRLVNKTYPKSHGTVDLRSITNLAAHALSPETTKRPSVKDLHNLFMMIDVQMKFLREIKIEFKKWRIPYIWRNKLDQRRLKTYYTSIIVQDELEFLNEDESSNINDQRESNVSTRSVWENDSILKIGCNIVDIDAPEFKTLLAYSACTFHDRSAYERSVSEIKSGMSELSGTALEKTKVKSSKIDELQENLEKSKLFIGDASHEIEKNDKNLTNKQDEDARRAVKKEKEECELTENEVLYKDFEKQMSANHDKKSHYIKGTTTTSEENNTANVSRKDIEKSYSKTEVSSEMVVINEAIQKEQEPKSISKTAFSSGKWLINSFIKFSFDCYQGASNNYEISSSNNYLHRLSKQLTRDKKPRQ